MSLAERIAKKDRKPVPFDVPQWGETIYIRPLSVADRIALETVDEGSPLIIAALKLSVTDELGIPLWADQEQVAALEVEPVLAVWAEVKRVNKLGRTQAEVDDEKKDSSPTPNGDSPSASPSLSAEP